MNSPWWSFFLLIRYMQWNSQPVDHWQGHCGPVGLRSSSTPKVYNMASFQKVHNRIGESFCFVSKRRYRGRQHNRNLASIAALCVPCATFIDETKSLPDLYHAKLLYHKSYIPPPSSHKNSSWILCISQYFNCLLELILGLKLEFH